MQKLCYWLAAATAALSLCACRCVGTRILATFGESRETPAGSR